MVVKNITSNIAQEKTIMEIEKALSNFGAKGIYKEYEGNNVKEIMFYLEKEGQKIPFKMPMNLEKARRVVKMAVDEGKLPRKYYDEPLRTEKALIVGWRLIKDWIIIQLSLLEIEFADPLELLLAYAYNPIENKTMYEKIVENKDKFLALEVKECEKNEK